MQGLRKMQFDQWQKTKDPRIRKRGDTYYARFSKRGIRVQDSLYTNKFGVAVKLVDEIENRILNSQDYKEFLQGKDFSGVPLFHELWPLFLNDKSKGNQKKGILKCRERTLDEYVNMGERYFKDFWGNYRLDQINSDAWEKYCEYARNKSSKGNELTLFNHWKHFNGFCSWAVKLDYLEKKPFIFNPDKETFKDDEVDSPGINLTDEQIRNLLNCSHYHDRFHLYISMAIFMGMRSSEITQLKKNRIDFKKGLIRLRKLDTKTKQAREVPIHPLVIHILEDQFNSHANDVLFPNANDPARPMDPTGFKKLWDTLLDRTKIECRPHDLRHSCATRLFGNPAINPVIACKILGMSMKVAMKTYIHFTEGQLVESICKLKLEEPK